MREHACLPVFLSAEVADLHYNGFSNGIIWPLFHYLPGEIDFDERKWDAYYRANVAFANAVRDVARDGDLIWVQDYHLMLMPALLKEALGNKAVKIGFFLHIPFPSSEVSLTPDHIASYIYPSQGLPGPAGAETNFAGIVEVRPNWLPHL